MVECDECKKPCIDCNVGTLSEVEQMRILGNGKSEGGYKFLYELIGKVERARRLHPKFAEGPYEAIGRITAEVGELVQAVEKGEGRQREKDEIMDAIVTLLRMWQDEHEVVPA